jgi:hypothetical protein
MIENTDLQTAVNELIRVNRQLSRDYSRMLYRQSKFNFWLEAAKHCAGLVMIGCLIAVILVNWSIPA